MDNDLPPPWISDLDLARLIERVTCAPATAADVRSWRLAIERERARRARRRCGLPPVMRAPDVEAANGIIKELFQSPEAQILIALLWAGQSLATAALDESARRLYDRMLGQRSIARDLRTDLDGLHRYASEKLAPGGRRPAAASDPAHSLPGAALVALNASTPAALAKWRDRLAVSHRSPATRPRLLAALKAAGSDVRREYPDLDLGHPMPGPALGFWPPPTPDPGLACENDPEAVPVPPGRR